MLLDPGEAVDVAGSGAALGASAADEDDPADTTLAHGAGDERAEPVGVAHRVRDDVRGRVDEEQGPHPGEGTAEERGVGEIACAHLDALADLRSQTAGVADEGPGPHAGLQEQPDDPGPDVAGGGGDGDHAGTLTRPTDSSGSRAVRSAGEAR